MKPLRYAVVDVETTGGFASGHRVTEVGIAISDGTQIIEAFQTLINPERAIPHYITRLTGITDDMVADAPTFGEVAKTIHGKLKDAVFVAHHVDFDYSFIRNEFSLVEIDFKARKLCTVRYARGVLHDQPRFGLARLAERFQIENADPHRALSDAMTAAEILHRLIELDGGGEVLAKKISKMGREVKIPVNLPPNQFHDLPHAPGVYKFYGANGKPLYIGKSKDIKARVTTHFREAKAARTQVFMRQITKVEAHLTGTEFMALVKEDVEIRKYWPPYNSAQKRGNFSFHVFSYHDHAGANRLGIKRARRALGAIKTFQSLRAARLWVHEMTKQFKLNADYTGMPSSWYDFEQPSVDDHNARFRQFEDEMNAQCTDFVLLEKGRTSQERAFVWVKDGITHAFGFAPRQADFQNPDVLEMHGEEVYSSPTLEQIIATHLVTNGQVEIVPLETAPKS